ncbi:transposase [Streptomyces massasporeus]
MLGRQAVGRRRLIDGIRWRVRTGAPSRDLPREYGQWQTVYGLFGAHIPQRAPVSRRGSLRAQPTDLDHDARCFLLVGRLADVSARLARLHGDSRHAALQGVDPTTRGRPRSGRHGSTRGADHGSQSVRRDH